MASPLSKLFANVAVAVDHRFGWDKLPKPLGIVTLIGLRTKLREQNLYDTGRGATPDPTPDDGHHLTARTIDGTYNDLELADDGRDRRALRPQRPARQDVPRAGRRRSWSRTRARSAASC